MKLRAQRVHHMGASNRDQDIIPQHPKNVFQMSYNKSHSSYYKTSQSLPPADSAQPKTAKPFKGSNVELETVRWNTKSKRAGKEHQWKLEDPLVPLDYSAHLNEEVADISKQLKGRDVNMFKLNQLKRTFVKNNRNRRYLQEYFRKFATNGKIGVEQLQDIVGQYGYDITADEAKVIFKLTGAQNDGLKINQFVELMSRDNIHFSTLKIEGATGEPRQHFQQRIHLVFKNKFNQLRQAFRIYRMREQPIDESKYDYVMKKLDINDLIITEAERKELFDRFKNRHGHFNAEALFCAIAEQELTLKPTFPPKLSDFDSNLRTNDEALAKISKKTAYFDFKRMSHLQYQNQLFKAQQILRQIKKLGEEGANIIAKKGGSLTRQEMLKEAEGLLKNKGINFTKQDYDCFSSYFDYNNTQKITDKEFKTFLQENTQKSQERFQRRLRALAPLQSQPETVACHQNTALQSLQRIKSKKLDPQTKVVFKDFDKDKDGYISRSQLKHKLKKLAVLQNWQVQNLTNYFDPEGKGYVNYDEFAKKYDNSASQTDLNFSRQQPISKLKSHSDWLNTKKSFIKETNKHVWNAPTKYSAWPERLRNTDMSLVQPPSKAGQFISEAQRFNSTEKHNVGQQFKQQKQKIYQNKLRKLAAWNDQNQQKITVKQQQFEQRCQANDYSMRLTKQIYQQRCHQKS